MPSFGVLIAIIFIGMLLLLPVYQMSKWEPISPNHLPWRSIIANLLFMSWSIYTLLFAHRDYPHGFTLSDFIIIPAWPLYMVFYLFIYPRIVMHDYKQIISLGLAACYGTGILLGIVTVVLIR